MDPSTENLLGAYSVADYTVFFQGLRLRFHVGDIAPESLPRPMALITAWNPFREKLSHEMNQAANGALLNDIKELGLEHWGALAEDHLGEHREVGFAVHPISEQEAIHLGAQHGQLAIVYLDEKGVRLLQCRTDV